MSFGIGCWIGCLDWVSRLGFWVFGIFGVWVFGFLVFWVLGFLVFWVSFRLVGVLGECSVGWVMVYCFMFFLSQGLLC